jgi:hypothetical protein
LLIAVASACSSAPPFQPLQNAPPDKAVIYLYRIPVPSGGRKTEFTIQANERRIGTLPPRSCLTYLSAPGSVTFQSHVVFKFGATGLLDVAMAPDSKLALQVEAGRTYCIEAFDTEPYEWGYGQALGLRAAHLEDARLFFPLLRQAPATPEGESP